MTGHIQDETSEGFIALEDGLHICWFTTSVTDGTVPG